MPHPEDVTGSETEVFPSLYSLWSRGTNTDHSVELSCSYYMGWVLSRKSRELEKMNGGWEGGQFEWWGGGGPFKEVSSKLRTEVCRAGRIGKARNKRALPDREQCAPGPHVERSSLEEDLRGQHGRTRFDFLQSQMRREVSRPSGAGAVWAILRISHFTQSAVGRRCQFRGF